MQLEDKSSAPSSSTSRLVMICDRDPDDRVADVRFLQLTPTADREDLERAAADASEVVALAVGHPAGDVLEALELMHEYGDEVRVELSPFGGTDSYLVRRHCSLSVYREASDASDIERQWIGITGTPLEALARIARDTFRQSETRRAKP